MADFGINEMLRMQKTLQEKYKAIWEGISPDAGKNKLLWMIGEIGEVIDIIKKHGGVIASQDTGVRRELKVKKDETDKALTMAEQCATLIKI